MLGTDGVHFPHAPLHPRFYRSVGRILGDCVKKYKLFSIEKAIQKLTQKAAHRYGLLGRGIIKEGNFADLCIFDQQTIGEYNSVTTGIKKVFVNGNLVYDVENQDCLVSGSSLPGRVLKRQ